VVSKTHHIKGEVFIHPFNSFASWPKKLKTITIGSCLYQVESYRPHKNGFIFKLKDINHIDQAQIFKSQDVFISKSDFLSLKQDNIYLSEILNFQVDILNQDFIGHIQSFKSTAFQDYLIVKTDNKSYQIPFVPEYIQSINFLTKQLTLKLPQNFLEICSD